MFDKLSERDLLLLGFEEQPGKLLIDKENQDNPILPKQSLQLRISPSFEPVGVRLLKPGQLPRRLLPGGALLIESVPK